MAEWWTYRPEDFLLFSERVYVRLFALQNGEWWPLQLFALAAGALVLAALYRPRRGADRAIALVLAVAFAFSAWAFLWERYGPINWAARYAALAFACEAALLLFFAIGPVAGRLRFRGAGGIRRSVGVTLVAFGVLLYPAMAPLSGRPLAEAEVFALAPDPTAVAALGLLATVPGRFAPLLLMPVPLAWCLFSAATLATLGTVGAAVPLAAAILAVLARLVPDRGG